jgi:hypothetical protein
MKHFLLRLKDQYHERTIQAGLRRLFGAIVPWDVIVEAEAQADKAAGLRPHRRGADFAKKDPTFSQVGYMARGGQIERRTADEVRREAAAVAQRMEHERLKWDAGPQITMWYADCPIHGKDVVHSSKGCTSCRPLLGPRVKPVEDQRKLCHFCHCPGAVIAVDVSESYTRNVYHQVCPRCLVRLLQGELESQPKDMGR